MKHCDEDEALRLALEESQREAEEEARKDGIDLDLAIAHSLQEIEEGGMVSSFSSSSSSSSSTEFHDEQLDAAIAQSLAAPPPSANTWCDGSTPVTTKDFESLDKAIAVSLDARWECRQCSTLNDQGTVRCSQCGSWVTRSRAELASVESELEQATTGVKRVRCGLPGCGAYIVSSGAAVADFCSPEHRHKAEARGLLAPAHAHVVRVYAGIGSDGTTPGKVANGGGNGGGNGSGDDPNDTFTWTAHELTRAHTQREGVVQLFLANWRKPIGSDGGSGSGAGGRPSVQRVFALRPPARVMERFSRYLAQKGNVRTLFHGTGLRPGCNFGIDVNARPCSSSGCSVCNICREGFRVQRSGANGARRMALRYGRGLYFSATSGKSNDYSAASERERPLGNGRRVPWRLMFVCQVSTGRTHETRSATIQQAELDLLLGDSEEAAEDGGREQRRPPRGVRSSAVGDAGHSAAIGENGRPKLHQLPASSSRGGLIDSITGVPSATPGGLNYDEVVTYSDSSAMPTFLVAYALT